MELVKAGRARRSARAAYAQRVLYHVRGARGATRPTGAWFLVAVVKGSDSQTGQLPVRFGDDSLRARVRIKHRVPALGFAGGIAEEAGGGIRGGGGAAFAAPGPEIRGLQCAAVLAGFG